MLGTTWNTARSSTRRATGSAGSSRRSSMPSTNHSAIVSPGCWRAITQIDLRPRPPRRRSTRFMSRPSIEAPRSRTRARGEASARAEQREMALPRVRLEVRVVDAVARGLVRDHELAAVERGRHPEPVLAIVRSHGLVAAPAVEVRRLARVDEADAHGLPARALQAEVEPLPEVGVRVGAQPDLQVRRRRARRPPRSRRNRTCTRCAAAGGSALVVMYAS